MVAESYALSKLEMSPEIFDRFSTYIQDELGIRMGRSKQVMLQARLTKRLRRLGLKSYEDYYNYLFSAQNHDDEIPYFVDQVTTNKTDFFREPRHFQFLTERALPSLMLETRYSLSRPLRVWSAACSTGEEVYTLAMVLEEYDKFKKRFSFEILGTDISPAVLKKASEGIYEEPRVAPIPAYMKAKYLLRSRDKNKKLTRITPELRDKTYFQWINLRADSYNIQQKMDIIFCRNVMIYFNRAVQEKVVNRICDFLLPGGYLFMGHSETISGFDLPLMQVKPTIYRKL